MSADYNESLKAYEPNPAEVDAFVKALFAPSFTNADCFEEAFEEAATLINKDYRLPNGGACLWPIAEQLRLLADQIDDRADRG